MRNIRFTNRVIEMKHKKSSMKNRILSGVITLVVMVVSVGWASGQSVAVINIADILENMQDYKSAQEQLDKLAETWQQEINAEFEQIKTMYNKYNAEQVLLSNSEKQQREDEIINREKEVRELQRQKFGPEGELFAKRKQLVEPIQDKVYNAVQEYADLHNIDLILDKSSSSGIIFSSDKYDKTADIKKMLGIR